MFRIMTGRTVGEVARDAWCRGALVLYTASSPAWARRPRPPSAQTPPPNPTAAGPDASRVLSRVGVADHAVTPQAPLRGSGWRESSNGGFGGGACTFHPHEWLPGNQVSVARSKV